jgi:hypothetical protein
MGSDVGKYSNDSTLDIDNKMIFFVSHVVYLEGVF